MLTILIILISIFIATFILIYLFKRCYHPEWEQVSESLVYESDNSKLPHGRNIILQCKKCKMIKQIKFR